MAGRDTPDDVPDDVPIPDVAISVPIVAKTAEDYDVGATRLVEVLEDVDAHLAERARDLTEAYTHKYGEDAILLELEQEPQQHMYVDPVEWDEIRVELSLDESVVQAARAAHNREYERLATETDWYDPVERLETCDVLIMQKPIVQDFLEAGLSYRQAFIQTRRMAGDTHEEIGTKLSIATGTVKTHCNRIDRKIERAERLLGLVDDREIPRAAVADLTNVEEKALGEAIEYVSLFEEMGEQTFETVPDWITTARTTLETAQELSAD